MTVVYRGGATDKDGSVTGWDIAAVQLNGDVVKLSWPPYGIDQMAMRVARIAEPLATAAVAGATWQLAATLPSRVATTAENARIDPRWRI